MMKTWNEFNSEDSNLVAIGKKMLYQSGSDVGFALLATLRKDGAPRLHPISLVFSDGHLYVLIPLNSPKCSDLKRDGRYALQAFLPPKTEDNEEFYLAGCAEIIQDLSMREALLTDTKIHVEEDEVLFELYLDRAMYSWLENRGTPKDFPMPRKWRAAE